MRRLLTLVLVSFFVVSSLAFGVEAQRRRGRGRQQAPRPQAAAQSAEIAPAIKALVGDDLGWGATSQQVRAHFRGEIEAQYREPLQKATGSLEQDRVIANRNRDIAKLSQNFTVFRGQPTGWESSFLRGHFTHNNREAMLERRDANSQNFLFFIQNKLWKVFKAFDAAVFQGQGFDQFAEALKARFGETPTREGTIPETGQQGRWLEWQDRTTRLRAIDLTQFYGFYCLVFEDKEVLANLETLRPNAQPEGDQRHSVVQSLVNANEDQTDTSQNQDIVDRVTGHIRRRDNADAGTGNSQTPTENTSMSTSMSTSMTTMTQGGDDPFNGMDL